MRFSYSEIGEDGVERSIYIDDEVGFLYKGLAGDFQVPKEIFEFNECEYEPTAQEIIDECD